MDATKFSRNYMIGSLEGNMIFDKENNLPTEVMLEMTLNAFGYDIDMVEVHKNTLKGSSSNFGFITCSFLIFYYLLFSLSGWYGGKRT